MTPVPPIRFRTGIEHDPERDGWWVLVETGTAGAELERTRYGQPPTDETVSDLTAEPVPFPTEAAAAAFAELAAAEIRRIMTDRGITVVDGADHPDRPRLVLPDDAGIVPGLNRAARRRLARGGRL